LVRTLPDTLKYENQLIIAEGDYVIAHGRFSGHGRPASWIAADIVRFEDGKLAEHWDVLQDEATRAQSISGLPMFGDRFPAWSFSETVALSHRDILLDWTFGENGPRDSDSHA
jgi:hypothetical protein